jgi:putative transposase
MDCVACGSAAVTERPEHTARGYRRFRCRDCGKQYNERSGGLLNHTHYPSDVIALVVLWRLRYRLTLRDLAEMFLQRGIDAPMSVKRLLRPPRCPCGEGRRSPVRHSA